MIKYFTPTKLSENIHETPEGFLICYDVPIGRTGQQVYGAGETPLDTNDEGQTLITRDPDELFNSNTIASFEGKPFTIRHPEEFVNPENWSELAKGVVQNVRKSDTKSDTGEEYLIADILVTDALAIQLVKSGVREVSCGYEAIYESTGKGKGRQTQIVGNHLALVEQGRAGPSYAIMDHKYKERSYMSKLAEQMKSFFSKAVDEAVASEKKEKAKDETVDKKDDKKDAVKDDGVSDIVAMLKTILEKIEGMKADAPNTEKTTTTAASDEDKDEDDKKDKAKDDEIPTGIEDRMKAMEMALAKILDKLNGEEDEEESEETGDEDEKSSMTGDTASRAEILAPGIAITKDVMQKAIAAAYSTKDGKSVIESLTGGKAPTFDSAEKVSNLFIAASEIMKARRGTGLEKTKSGLETVNDAMTGPMSPEKLNEMNKAFWSRR